MLQLDELAEQLYCCGRNLAIVIVVGVYDNAPDPLSRISKYQQPG
jgi:hypothetical protein